MLPWAAPANALPVIRPIPECAAVEGAAYLCVLDLDEWVADPACPSSDLAWSWRTQADVVIHLTNKRHFVVSPPDADWFGTADITLTACNPAGECATQTLSLCVEGLPDAPILEWIPDQVTSVERPFAPLDLSVYGWDPDGGEGLEWSAAKSEHLRADLHGVEIVVSSREPNWTGTDAVVVTLRDPTGLTAERIVSYTVTEEPSVAILALGIEGFLIEAGGKKILIDAFVREGLPYTESERSRLRRGLSPFDGVSLALASHRHYDHFDAGYALDYLTASPRTTFVTETDAVDDLRRLSGFEGITAQILEIGFEDGNRTEIEVDGIRVTAFHLRHVVDGGPNLAFLIDIEGTRILHLGDASPFDYTVGELVTIFGGEPLAVDVVLASSYRWLEFESGTSLLRGTIAPRFAVPMHLVGACPFSFYDYPPIAGARLVKLCAKGNAWVVPPGDL